jgi:DNA invertase Pin-like site-specific DNA recombinase
VDDNSKDLLKKLDVLNKKIDILTTVTAIGIQKDKLLEGKIQRDQIIELHKLGLSRNIIALIVGTTPLTVSVTLSKLKKKAKKKKKQTEVGKNGNKGTN